jgi:hypothetical protein
MTSGKRGHTSWCLDQRVNLRSGDVSQPAALTARHTTVPFCPQAAHAALALAVKCCTFALCEVFQRSKITTLEWCS